ncbi:TPA: DUF3795 domain-containing protein [Thermoplasmata archaeon]|nr:DUF3795 domain-containing protein [Thermoplasmata archaeon]
MERHLVAPCGMNCNICAGYLASKHDVKAKGIRLMYCIGCRPRDKNCAFLKRGCELLRKGKVEYCYECDDFPCDRLSAMDKRYREDFRMSEIENLEYIRDHGIEGFLRAEEYKWRCPRCGGVTSCHNGICFECGLEELRSKKKKYRW